MNDNSPDRLAAGFGQAVQRGDWQAALGLAEALETALPGNAGAVHNKALVLGELGRADLDGCKALLDELAVPLERAALRLKVLTQGSRGCRA